MWPTLSHTQHPGMLHWNYSRSCLLRHASQTELLHSAEQLVLPSISSSNTWKWRNILGVCWPKGLQQWHNQSARGARFTVCALFSLLSTDYGNLLTGFRVPIEPHKFASPFIGSRNVPVQRQLWDMKRIFQWGKCKPCLLLCSTSLSCSRRASSKVNPGHLATRKSVLWKTSIDAAVEEFLDKPAREELPLAL